MALDLSAWDEGQGQPTEDSKESKGLDISAFDQEVQPVEIEEEKPKGILDLAKQYASSGAAKSEDLLKLFGKGASQGFSDELTGAVGTALEQLPKSDVDKELESKGFKVQSVADRESIGDTYSRLRDQERLAQKEAAQRQGALGTATEIAGNIAGGAGLGSAAGIGTNLGVKGIAGLGAATGALQSVGESEAGTIGELAQDIVTGAAIGGVTGAALPALGKGLSSVANSEITSNIKNTVLSRLTGMDQDTIKNIVKNPGAVRNAPELKDLISEVQKSTSKVYDNLNLMRGELFNTDPKSLNYQKLSNQIVSDSKILKSLGVDAEGQLTDSSVNKLRQIGQPNKFDAEKALQQLQDLSGDVGLVDAAKARSQSEALDVTKGGKLGLLGRLGLAAGSAIAGGPLGFVASAAALSPEAAKLAIKYGDLSGKASSKISQATWDKLPEASKQAVLQSQVGSSVKQYLTPDDHAMSAKAMSSDEKLQELQDKAQQSGITAFSGTLARIQTQEPETRERSIQMLLQQPAFRKFVGVE